MKKSLLKNPILLGSMGASIEWMEYSAYLYLVPILSRLFLPKSHPSQALLFMFLLFFATNLARSLGGFLFGFTCDHYGRKVGLTISPAPTTLASKE